MTKKGLRDPYNEKEFQFRASLTPKETLTAIRTMQFIGCNSRPVYVSMALADFAKNQGVRKELPRVSDMNKEDLVELLNQVNEAITRLCQ